MFNNCSGLNNDLFATPINIPVGISWTTYCCYDMFGGSCPVEPSSPSTPGQSIFVKRS
jgi:hypothetical protein